MEVREIEWKSKRAGVAWNMCKESCSYYVKTATRFRSLKTTWCNFHNTFTMVIWRIS